MEVGERRFSHGLLPPPMGCPRGGIGPVGERGGSAWVLWVQGSGFRIQRIGFRHLREKEVDHRVVELELDHLVFLGFRG